MAYCIFYIVFLSMRNTLIGAPLVGYYIALPRFPPSYSCHYRPIQNNHFRLL